ncbi:MAG: chemotaxis protein CheA [Gammaproteobacteria bacterium]|nr:chemotaxis protein CheA [Gammaproteobacteria bacterium]
MNLQPAHETFIAECKDLLADMEEALLHLEQQPDDEEAITAVFRAAHTIKGSAGVFGFNNIVEFTHVMESLLEEIRTGEVDIDSDIIALLLLCGDHLLVLLDETANDNQIMSANTHTANTALQERLKLYLSDAITSSFEVAVPDDDEMEIDTPGGTVASDAWHISLRFGQDVLRNGMDPLSFIRYMETLGTIVHIVTLYDAMPDADKMDPESCYLGLEIDFKTTMDKLGIEGIFDFVRDDCAIRILPPHSKVLDYIKLIEELPEDKAMLGELLIKSGSLTENELEDGIKLQKELDQAEDASETHKHKLGEILVGQGVVQPELVDAALKKQQIIKEHRIVESNLMRVRADKLDELITQVGELIIAASGARLLAQNSGDSELAEASLSIEELVEQVRESALRLRMVPIGDTFNRFNRVVRDVARDLDKQVELVISGSETELDKSMVDKISDPLMHLVRNALDHGIESIEERQKLGKSEMARVHLNAYHDSGSVVIEVADDGAGLNRNKILAKAIDRGLVSADQKLTDSEIYRLIMEPGFSTADSVTNVSGRGVGMDVVKRNVEALRGNITIDSTEGTGTVFTLRLPLTLAIIDGFLVKVGDSSYVVPLDMVVECFELSTDDRSNIKDHSYVNLRDEVLPLLRLRDVFDIHADASRRENIVVIKYAGQQAGLVVDALLGEFQTVIKPLGKLFERLSGISGSTILGHGEVALILDVPTLVQQMIKREEGRARRPKLNRPVKTR